MAANIADPELQAPPYPCGDLLDEGGRKDYLDIAVPLYRALIKGEWEATDTILDNDERNLVRYSITEKKDTPLHVAAARDRNIRFPSKLLDRLKTADLELQNADGNTAFCVAAISGNVDMVEEMFRRNNALQTICGNDNKLPLYLAAYHGKHDVVEFLYEKSNKMTGECWTNDSRNGVLMKCIESDIFDVALRILNDNNELPHDNYLWDVLHVLARKHKAFRVETQSAFTQYIKFIKSGKYPSMNIQHLYK
ncbi:uncharacterized protein LOC143627142 [Bidens hawaiensis]|uniref:uncharacterized protein LOC143627142 n=1 Tax=Bidens hawaiensis TaxID=980011 RepID=UPI00404A7FFA